MGFKLKNFTMEKFNNDVNNSGNLLDKYKNWTKYRNQITGEISKMINKTCKNIIVLGAGECNDIDLRFLVSTFDEVTLTDIDIQSIDDGIARQKLTQYEISKISKVQVDYTGLSKVGFFATLAKLAVEKTAHIKISTYINETISNLKIKEILPQHQEKYDMVLVCPTYTQLAYTQMEVLLKILYQHGIYRVDNLNKIITTMHRSMKTIIKNYNDLLLSLANKNGVIFVLTDIAEIIDEKNIKYLSDNIANSQLIKDWLVDNNLEFGEIGRSDLIAKIDVAHEFWVIWAFDKQVYLAIGQMADLTYIPEDVQAKMTIERGKIKTNKEGQVKGVPWMFAGGDIMKGMDIINGVANGHAAALGIDKFISKK